MDIDVVMRNNLDIMKSSLNINPDDAMENLFLKMDEENNDQTPKIRKKGILKKTSFLP
jgi:hypothetical protein